MITTNFKYIFNSILKLIFLFDYIYNGHIHTNNMNKEYVITITFGDCAENHVGMQKLGKLSYEGMKIKDIEKTQSVFEKNGFKCERFDLVKEANISHIKPIAQEAEVLIIRDAYKAFLGGVSLEELNKEVLEHEWDKHAFMRGRVVNKKARYNLIFSEESQEPDYENKKGRVIKYEDVPNIKKIREGLPDFFGEKASKLHAEGNYYYDMKNTYIGFHGDAERKIVVALRLGTVSMPFHYQWFQKGFPIGNRIILSLNPGDFYVMSEKAVGTDWLKKVIPTLRHATAMNEKLLKIKEVEIKEVKEESKDDSDDEIIYIKRK
jgi:hypothetical protein